MDDANVNSLLPNTIRVCSLSNLAKYMRDADLHTFIVHTFFRHHFKWITIEEKNGESFVARFEFNFYAQITFHHWNCQHLDSLVLVWVCCFLWTVISLKLIHGYDVWRPTFQKLCTNIRNLCNVTTETKMHMNNWALRHGWEHTKFRLIQFRNDKPTSAIPQFFLWSIFYGQLCPMFKLTFEMLNWIRKLCPNPMYVIMNVGFKWIE